VQFPGEDLGARRQRIHRRPGARSDFEGHDSLRRLPGAPGESFAIDAQASRFQYLVVNPASGEAEMRYHIEFDAAPGGRYIFEGRKFMDRTGGRGVAAIRELLLNYTTLYCHVYRVDSAGKQSEIGLACLKFLTFEDFAALGNLAGFLGSFTVTGTSDPLLQLRARMRFIAFTAQFAQREYDPLSPDLGRMSMDVRAEILRGCRDPRLLQYAVGTGSANHPAGQPADAADRDAGEYGSRRPGSSHRRVNRDLFWKGSFAKDSLVGLKNGCAVSRILAAAMPPHRGGAFWKRFDKVTDGVAAGYVVNYDLDALPGIPAVRAVAYPDDNRRYFHKAIRFCY